MAIGNKRSYWIASCLMTLLALQGSVYGLTPKLVVGIVVDQLRGDYLEQMLPGLSDQGFKRLIKEGAYWERLTFDFPEVDRASAYATLYTGTNPNSHGIVANDYYNRSLSRIEHILFDSKTMGNYTNETLSPLNLLVTTFTDELKMASQGISPVYSIAPNSQAALIAAGHSADGAFWIEPETGKWAGSTYYPTMPKAIDDLNRHKPLSMRIDTMQWKPLHKIEQYQQLAYSTNNFLFKHTFSKAKEAKYAQFKTSALVNDEVTNAAISLINNGHVTHPQMPGVLNIGYYAGTYQGMSVSESSVELQDIYYRLDKNIAQLLSAIDKQVGLKNCLIFLTSTGYFAESEKESQRYKTPGGEFYPNRSVSLLNVYLMAIYGQGNWVDKYHNHQIYLNEERIRQKGLNLLEIEQKSAEFLLQMSGVRSITTASTLLYRNPGIEQERIKQGYHRKRSGNLIIEIESGWEVVWEDTPKSRIQVRHHALPIPLILYGQSINPSHEKQPVKATTLTPKISQVLRIRPPSAADQHPLVEQ